MPLLASHIQTFLLRYTGAVDPSVIASFVRRAVTLEVDGKEPVAAALRDIRAGCCTVDLDGSICTLAYRDVTDIVPPDDLPGGLPRLRLRAGSLALDARARPAEAPPTPAPAARPERRAGKRDRRPPPAREREEEGKHSLEDIERMLREMK